MKSYRLVVLAISLIAMLGFSNEARADFYCYTELFDYTTNAEIWNARVEIRIRTVDDGWQPWQLAGVVDGNHYGWNFSDDVADIIAWEVHVFEADTPGYEGYTGRMPATQNVVKDTGTNGFNWKVTITS